VKAVNLKTVQAIDVPLPQNCRAVVKGITLVTREQASVSNGATVKVEHYDASLVASRVAATLSTALTGTNNDITLTAVTAGTTGNDITLALVDPSGNNAALGVVVTGTDIVVNLATNGGGTITSTAAQVIAAIAADEDAAALVTAANKSGNDGTGVVTALTETALTGGTDPDIVQSIVDSVNLADSEAVNKIQALTLAATKALDNGSALRFSVTTGSTATTHVADVVAELMFI
jgi:hypothetical protein